MSRCLTPLLLLAVSLGTGCDQIATLTDTRPNLQIISHAYESKTEADRAVVLKVRNNGGAGNVMFRYEDELGQTFDYPGKHFAEGEERSERLDLPAGAKFEPAKKYSVSWIAE